MKRIEALIAELLAQPWLALLARVALTSAFWLSGIFKLLDFPGAVAEIRGLSGLEPAALFAALVIVVQIGGSLLVIFSDRFAWLGAGALGVFTLLATLLAHAWWTKTGVERFRDFNTFWEHMGLVGGFALAAILAAKQRNKALHTSGST
jgi:transmembrane protein